MDGKILNLLSLMEDKDNSVAYKALLELEEIAENFDVLYFNTDYFAQMVTSEKYAIKIRGFRLFCKQAKWDKDNVIDKRLNETLSVLEDDRPTVVRQALTALHDVVMYKPSLRNTIKASALNIDYFRYKDTMHSLLQKDIRELIELIDSFDEKQN